MTELATFRKNKIELSEYDYEKDVRNRALMAAFTSQDVEVLEEILYSSLRIPLSVLEQNVELSAEELRPILDKLAPTGLFSVMADHVVVDKEMRKYFEQQILKFEEDFKPGMEHLQALLRKVPIHVLPTWYAISRTSNNIFESIVEKYLQTPQTYQRYLMDLNFGNKVQQGIMNAVYQSPDYEVLASDMLQKFDLTQEEFEEHMLHLEFNFVGCVKFEKQGDRFIEKISPFFEWQEYLFHIRDTDPPTIIDEERVERIKTSDFAVVEEMSTLLELCMKGPITTAAIKTLKGKCPEFAPDDFEYYAEKLSLVHLAEKRGEQLVCTSDTNEWLKMDLIARALYLYRHPSNTPLDRDLPEYCQSRILHEAEKSVARIVHSGWVYLDDFLKGILIPLNDTHTITLTRQGKNWKYQLPHYSEKELDFFKMVIKTWLFDFGMTALGVCEGKECFRLTPLGQKLFGNE